MRSLHVAAAVTAILFQLAHAPARAADYVVFKIYNDSTVPITGIYDKLSSRSQWGVNDLADLTGTGNPYDAPVRPVAPGHFFYIRMRQDAYIHCPGILLDVRIVFANGHEKHSNRIDICKYDLHLSRA